MREVTPLLALIFEKKKKRQVRPGLGKQYFDPKVTLKGLGLEPSVTLRGLRKKLPVIEFDDNS